MMDEQMLDKYYLLAPGSQLWSQHPLEGGKLSPALTLAAIGRYTSGFGEAVAKFFLGYFAFFVMQQAPTHHCSSVQQCSRLPTSSTASP